nr:hypothetical protein [Tanacetum cinerariifolium]
LGCLNIAGKGSGESVRVVEWSRSEGNGLERRGGKSGNGPLSCSLGELQFQSLSFILNKYNFQDLPVLVP